MKYIFKKSLFFLILLINVANVQEFKEKAVYISNQLNMIRKLHVLAILLFLPLSNKAQTIHYVRSGGTGNGLSWNSSSGNLQSTINSCVAGDQVWVAQGTYQPTIGGFFSMKEGVIILGGFPNAANPSISDRNNGIFPTILMGNGSNVIKNFFSSATPMTTASILDGFTITGGLSPTGAGINNWYASPTFRNLIITGNLASSNGGGVNNSYCSPIFINVLIHHNTCSAITSGVLSGGGGVYDIGGSPIFINTTIADNHAANDGGGIINQQSPAQFTNCILYGNTAPINPDSSNYSSNPTFTNCVRVGCILSVSYFPFTTFDYQMGVDGGDNIDADPLFMPDYSLQSNSPAINAGRTALYTGSALDCLGHTRIIDVVDIGMAEFQEAVQSILYVKQGATGSGSSWADASGDLREMTRLQVPGNQIWVAQGTYQPQQNNQSFFMKDGVKIYGGFPDTGNPDFTSRNPQMFTTILLANGTNTVCNYKRPDNPMSSSALLDGFTITRLNMSEVGSGIYNDCASPTLVNLKIIGNSQSGILNVNNSGITISHSVVSSNTGDRGAGILNNGSNSVVDDVVFENNSAFAEGGGIDCFNNGNVTLSNLTFKNNTAGNHGGAIDVSESTMTLTGGFFSENSAGWGGGILMQYSSVVLRDLVMKENTAGVLGGAVEVEYQSNCIMTNVLINNNHSNDGGGMGNVTSTVTMTNVTIANNTADFSAGGYICFSNSVSTIRNSIIYGNTATVQQQNIGYPENASFANSLIEGCGGSSNWTPSFGTNLGNNLDTNPRFVFAEGGDFELTRCSPAINAGDNALYAVGAVPNLSSITDDVASAPRFYNSGMVDMGAYEFQGLPGGSLSILYVNQNATGSNDGTSWINAYPLLQQAQCAACSGDQIWVAEGIYQPALKKSFMLKNDVAVYGGFPATGGTMLSDRNWGTHPSVLKGNGNSVVGNLYTAANPLLSSAILDGFTIENGTGYLTYSTSNYPFGGGIVNSYASPTLSNLKIQNNTASKGGGVYNTQGSSGTFTNVSITNNTASSGGGFAIESSAPVLINTTIAGNIGGGINVGGSLLPVIRNSIIYDNINNSLPLNVEGQSTFYYSLIQGCGGSAWNSVYGTNGGNNLDSNPLFSTNFSLLAGSPAIDSGNNSLYPITGANIDLSGNTRIYGATIDRGAYEYNPNLGVDQQEVEQIGVYPVPAYELLHILLKNDMKVIGTTIINMNGKKIIEQENDSVIVNVQSLATGIYMLVVETTEGKFRCKFSK